MPTLTEYLRSPHLLSAADIYVASSTLMPNSGTRCVEELQPPTALPRMRSYLLNQPRKHEILRSGLFGSYLCSYTLAFQPLFVHASIDSSTLGFFPRSAHHHSASFSSPVVGTYLDLLSPLMSLRRTSSVGISLPGAEAGTRMTAMG